jgi:hypothetical protein
MSNQLIKTQYTNQTFLDVIIYTSEKEKLNVPSNSSIEFKGTIKKTKFIYQ